MRVDAHHHVWDLDVRDQAWLHDPSLDAIRRNFPGSEYDALTRKADIDASVLVQTANIADETTEMCRYAEQSPVVSAVVGWVDLLSPSLAADLIAVREQPGGRWLRGIRHQVQLEPDNQWLCRSDVRSGLATVGADGLIYELIVVPDQLPAVVETVRALPDVRFVLDHCGKPPIASGDLTGWRDRMRELAALPNVSCKLSGLVTEADWASWSLADLRPVAEVILDEFGADRVMIGSDWPVCLLAGDLERVMAAYDALLDGCTEYERAMVRGGTATSTYGIG